MNGQGSIEDARRKLEKILGYPPGAFDPTPIIQKDAERVAQALGKGLGVEPETVESLEPLEMTIQLKALANSLGAKIQAMFYGK